MELTINKDRFKRFLDLIMLSGEHQIKEALFSVKKDLLSSLIKSPTNSVGVSASIKGKFNELDEIGIDDLILLKNSLNLQDKEEITLKIKDNKIVVSSGKTKASLVLRKSDYIKNKPKKEDFEKYISQVSGNEFVLSEDDIEKIIKAYNLIKSENILISSEGKTIKFIFSRMDNEIETEIDLKTEIEPFKINITSFVLYLLDLLGKTTLNIKKDVPIIIIKNNEEDLNITYIVATYSK